MDSIDNPKYSNTVVTTSIVAGIVLFISIVAAVTWYTASSKDYVPNNTQSQNKITVLNEALRSSLGPKWPFILLIFTLIIAFILVLLYLLSKKDAITVTLSDGTAHTLNIIFIVFSVIFSIFIVVLAVKQYLAYRNQQNTGDIPNYTPSTDQQKQNMKILTIVGLGLFVLISGSFAVWYFFYRTKVQNSPGS